MTMLVNVYRHQDADSIEGADLIARIAIREAARIYRVNEKHARQCVKNDGRLTFSGPAGYFTTFAE